MKKFLFSTILFAVICFVNPSTLKAEGCRIDFNIKGLENKNVFFGYQYGKKQVITDTLHFDANANAHFTKKSRLTGGIYVLVFPSKKYMELLINKEQFFSLQSDTSDIIGNMVIEGSDESSLYRDYQTLATKINLLKKENRKNANQRDSITTIKGKLKNFEYPLDSFRLAVIIQYPKSFIATYFKMMNDPQIPEMLIYQNPEPNRGFFMKKYQYTRAHYFDNFDFSDTRILRTSLITEKMEYFFNRLITQKSDTIIHEIKKLATLSKVNEESYQFVLGFILANYRNPRNKEQEKVLVFVADYYFLNGKATWVDKRVLSLLEKKVAPLRTDKTEGLPAPDLTMLTPEGKKVQLSSIEAKYLVVYFWSPDCEVCQNETPQLYNIYKQYKNKGLKVYAVYVHSDKDMWINYLKKNYLDWINVYDPLLETNFSKLYKVDKTPTIYLLDNEKVMINNNLTVKSLEEILQKQTSN